jgi:hypothetical protein
VGNNNASAKKWYERMIKVAETLFKTHLEHLEKEDKKNETRKTNP